MTALASPPAPSPVSRPRPGDELRFPLVFANLLPDEVVIARRVKRLQRNLVVGLIALLAVLVLGYGLSWMQTQAADNSLASQQHQTVTLQGQLQRFGPLLQAQSSVTAIDHTLASLMTNDLSWRDLITKLDAQLKGDATITSITGTVTDPSQSTGSGDASAGGLSALDPAGTQIVGSLTITGTAKDKRGVAAFVQRLGSVKGITAPLPQSITGDHSSLLYSISALITSDALGSRYANVASTATGGK